MNYKPSCGSSWVQVSPSLIPCRPAADGHMAYNLNAVNTENHVLNEILVGMSQVSERHALRFLCCSALHQPYSPTLTDPLGHRLGSV